MKKRILVFSLFIILGCLSQAMAATKTVWTTNWNVMTLWQDGNSVTGEYIYDNGILTGTMEGKIFKGYWRESGNAKSCGLEVNGAGLWFSSFRTTGNHSQGHGGPAVLTSTALIQMGQAGQAHSGTE